MVLSLGRPPPPQAFYPPMPNSPHTPIPIAGFEISIPPEYAEFLRFAGDTQTNWEPLKVGPKLWGMILTTTGLAQVSMSCNRFANVGPDHWVVGGSRQGQAASVCKVHCWSDYLDVGLEQVSPLATAPRASRCTPASHPDKSVTSVVRARPS